MVDRVPAGLGLVGQVGDAAAMASNIAKLLASDRSEIADRARQHALQFSWEESMAKLFGEVYRSALQSAASRSAERGTLPQTGFVEA
jgi:glycosyltransferase involved in cell wall biosynthesis